MMKKFMTLPKYLFASEAVKSVEGHKPPAIADSAPGRYAGALFTAASKNEALDVVLKDMVHLGNVLKQEEVIREFFKNSAIKRPQQRQVISSFAPKNYHEISNNFLETLVETGRLGDAEKIIEKFISYCKILNKQQDIKIISAKDLSEEEKSQVIAAIKQNKPDVKFKISYEVDPSILGGLQVFAGTDFLDCSLRSRINKLKLELARIA